ncbi:MAG: CHAT domain-containing protein [Caldilineaceae bacterium]
MITILFLKANPDDTTRLNIDDEIREIDKALQQAKLGKHFDLRVHGAVRIDDLQELFERYRPGIVHFSGHGSTTGEMILQDDQGKAITVPIDALSNLFGQFSDNIRCVVLNACHSDAQASAIARYIDCVIGMSDALSDKAALNFSPAFYNALGNECSIQSAFDNQTLFLRKSRTN